MANYITPITLVFIKRALTSLDHRVGFICTPRVYRAETVIININRILMPLRTAASIHYFVEATEKLQASTYSGIPTVSFHH